MPKKTTGTRSLKEKVDTIATAVGTSHATVYDKYLALYQAGVLPSNPGKGPGSGVRATPEAAAIRLIGLMASEGLSGIDKTTRTYCNLKNGDGQTLASALADVLAADNQTGVWLRIQRQLGQAILNVGTVMTLFSKHIGGGPKPPRMMGLFYDVTLYQGFDAIAKALRG